METQDQQSGITVGFHRSSIFVNHRFGFSGKAISRRRDTGVKKLLYGTFSRRFKNRPFDHIYFISILTAGRANDSLLFFILPFLSFFS